MELPLEIIQHIYCKLLRLTLDEIEEEDFMLIKTDEPNFILGLFGYKEKYNSVNNIEWYIRLLIMKPLNTNVNISSYKGRSIFHLLVRSATFCSWRQLRENHQYLHNKIRLLCKYGVNINNKNFKGNTILHNLISLLCGPMVFGPRFNNYIDTVNYLIESGASIDSIKNKNDKTAFQIGKDIIVTNCRHGKLDEKTASYLITLLISFKSL